MARIDLRRGGGGFCSGIIIFTLLCVGAILRPSVAWAQFVYTTTNGVHTIVSYTGIGGAVTLPSSSSGKPVMQVAAGAFYGRKLVTSISVPSSITNIEAGAFARCTALTAFTVNALNTNYSSVDGVLFDRNQTTLLQYPLARSGGAYTVPSGVTAITSWAFAFSTNLTNITFPDGLLSIGRCAFRKCPKLGPIVLPDSVTTLGVGAFSYCPGLTNFTVPAGVTSIEEYTFALCTNLTELNLGGSLTNLGRAAFYHCGRLGSIALPAGLTRIGDGAFFNCYSLSNAPIPASVATIEPWAFCRATNLTGAAISGNTSSVGRYAFSECANFGSLTLSEGVADLGEGAFSGCDWMTTVTIPASLTNIGAAAFTACGALSAFNVSPANPVYSSVDGVLLDLAQSTVIKCPEGKSGTFTIPGTVTNIQAEAFAGCSSLASISIPESVASIGSWGFAECSTLTTINVPAAVTSIEDSAFRGCASLTAVTLGAGVTNISFAAFGDCLALTNIALPPSLQTIGNYAFGACGLVNLVIPDSTKTIASGAFSRCTNLVSITIGSGVTNIGSYVFVSNSKLTGIYFRGNTPTASQLFFQSTPIIYYLPDTTGWAATFNGRPTAVWKPQLLPISPDYGSSANQFAFHIQWADGRVVVVETATDFANPDWQPLATNLISGGISYFNDAQGNQSPQRFYRVRSPLN